MLQILQRIQPVLEPTVRIQPVLEPTVRIPPVLDQQFEWSEIFGKINPGSIYNWSPSNV